MENAGTGRRVLIVGTGFVGSTVLRHLDSQSIKADSLSRHEQYDGSHYDYVVYARGRNKGHDNYAEDVNNAVGFMYDVMRAGVGKVLLISSGAYKSMTSPYDAAKYEIEMIASRILGDRLCIARLFSFIGPHVPQHFGIMQMIRDGLAGCVKVKSSEAVRSYLFEDDLGYYLAALLFSDKTKGDAVDVGGWVSYSMADVGRMIASYCGCDVELKDNGDRSRYVPNLGTLYSLGVHSGTSLPVAISRTVNALTWGQQSIKLPSVHLIVSALRQVST